MNDEPLGTMSDGPRDDRLNTAADPLKLPRGAFIALRQSGGLRFSTREVLVYHDGRVVSRRQGKLDAREEARRITPDEVADLKTTITHCSLRGLPATIGRQSPDGYAYELIARSGRKSKSIEFFDGSIPSEVQPLLAQLQALMAVADAQEWRDGSATDMC